MNATSAGHIAVAVGCILAMGSIAHAEAAPDQGSKVTAGRDTSGGIETETGNKGAAFELPEITINAKQPGKIARLESIPRVSTCDECALCTIVYNDLSRWQRVLIDEDETVFRPAIIVTLREGGIVLHWRRFVTSKLRIREPILLSAGSRFYQKQ